MRWCVVLAVLLVPAAHAATSDGIAAGFRDEMERMKAPSLAFAVVRGEDVVLQKAWGHADPAATVDATPETLYEIGSVTKLFTATLLVMLRDEGKLALDDPLVKWVPEAKLPVLPGARPVTLRMLASHVSGLPRVPALPMTGDDPWAGVTEEALLKSLPELRLLTAPGEAVAYSNLGYALLGLALQRASGMPYERLLRERIFVPLGMTRSFVGWDAAGEARAAVPHAGSPPKPVSRWHLAAGSPAGGIVSCLRDMTRFASLHLKASSAEPALVHPWSLRETQLPQRLSARWDVGAGLGWHAAFTNGLGEWCWHSGRTGGFSSALGLSLEHGVAIVVLTNVAADSDKELTRLMVESAEVFGRRRDVAVPQDVRAFVASLARAFDEKPDDDLAALLDPATWTEGPIANVRTLFRTNWASHGRATAQRFQRPTDHGYRVAFHFADGAELACRLYLTNAGPPLLTGIWCRPPEPE